LSRRDQDRLVSWVLDALDAPVGAAAGFPPMTTDELAMAGLATGLTALAATLLDKHSASGPGQPLLDDQRREVAARQERFAVEIPRVLRAFVDASVPVTPVKGAVLAWSRWPYPLARPMSDIDLVVSPVDRSRAAAAMAAAGFAQSGSEAWEDTFLAWGDGSVGRVDGESADHNGKVEVHPGWVERLHNYLLSDDGIVMASAAAGTLRDVPCLLLPPAPFAAQVIGHLSASVIRAEARAVNLLDVLFTMRALDAKERTELLTLVGKLDGRLTAPGLWLLEQYRPGVVDADLLALSMSRLRPTARHALAGAQRFDAWRSLGTRTTLRWRFSFTVSAGERLRMLRQLYWPTESGRVARLRHRIGRRG
jgi:Uncharacterised nucleotidyltransferase